MSLDPSWSPIGYGTVNCWSTKIGDPEFPVEVTFDAGNDPECHGFGFNADCTYLCIDDVRDLIGLLQSAISFYDQMAATS